MDLHCGSGNAILQWISALVRSASDGLAQSLALQADIMVFMLAAFSSKSLEH